MIHTFLFTSLGSPPHPKAANDSFLATPGSQPHGWLAESHSLLRLPVHVTHTPFTYSQQTFSKCLLRANQPAELLVREVCISAKTQERSKDEILAV